MCVEERSVCILILEFKLSVQCTESSSLAVISRYHVITLSPHSN